LKFFRSKEFSFFFKFRFKKNILLIINFYKKANDLFGKKINDLIKLNNLISKKYEVSILIILNFK